MTGTGCWDPNGRPESLDMRILSMWEERTGAAVRGRGGGGTAGGRGGRGDADKHQSLVQTHKRFKRTLLCLLRQNTTCEYPG